MLDLLDGVKLYKPTPSMLCIELDQQMETQMLYLEQHYRVQQTQQTMSLLSEKEGGM